MPDDSVTSQVAALQVIQQAVDSLIRWAKNDVSHDALVPLRLVFDRVRLTQEQPSQVNYRPAWSLEPKKNEQSEENEKTPRIPYPQSKERTEAELDDLKQEIQRAVKELGSQLGRTRC
jgi:hypothetical protein